jgi:cytochrome c-type biogenesis protein CcmH
LLGPVAIACIAVLIVRSQPDDSLAARAARLERQLACPVCEGQSVADSNAPESRQIRADIPTRLRAGESDAEIRAAYVRAYGDRILLSPEGSGLGAIAWGLPALVIVAGAGGIVVALRRWARTPRLAATADDEGVVRDAREHRLDDEAERDFLLRSLDDLELERGTGNIDDETYRVLHDDYTARAAAAIRSLADGVEPTALAAPSVPLAMRVLTVGGIVVFAVAAAFLLIRTAGERHAGQQITGGVGATATTNPNSYLAHLQRARALLGANDGKGALEQYFAAVKLDPTQPEPLAYVGWLSALQAEQTSDAATRNTLLEVAKRSLDRAITVDKSYADAYVFEGLLLYRIEHRPAQAVPMLQQFLVLAPQDHPMRAQVLSVLADAIAATKPSTTTSSTRP